MARRNTVAANIEKACNTGFDLNEELEKARSGVYADTAENRKMNRVGQKYGSEKKEDEPKVWRKNIKSYTKELCKRGKYNFFWK